jgi:hypothetical protein
MKRQTRLTILLAAVLGVGGAGFAWYMAVTSTEASAARHYLLTSPAMQAKYQKVEDPILTAFRISNSKSHFTYWARTPQGRVFVRLMVNKDADPWTITEPQ